MSDPKNIPINEARLGDMVFLKPMQFNGLGTYGTYGAFVTKPDGQSMAVTPEWIDHIERAPRPLAVGDRVRGGVDRGTIHAIVGLRAAVIWDCSTANWPLLTSLERVDG